MCGFVGCNFRPNHSFERTVSLLKSRGPDYTGMYTVDDHHFGHTRLSIVDRNSCSHQPMVLDDIVLVFNGEIYNYSALKKSESLECKTQGDTEVILRLYQKYGTDFLPLLNGMFSFCLYDRLKNRYFCARDRYGKKPFYYYQQNKTWIFSSLIKPIVDLLGRTPNMNKTALSQYLQHFSPIQGETFFEGIRCLEAGSYLLYDGNELKQKRYYKINTYKSIFDEQQALKDIESLLLSSVEDRLCKEVSMGALLSGGLDSSMVCALYKRISGKSFDTFSIGYNEYKNYDELSYATHLASHLGLKHHTVEMTQRDFTDSFETVLDVLEEPHADSAALPLHCLMQRIHKEGIPVVLSGEGSDEIFLGYSNYRKFLDYYRFKETLSTDQLNFLGSMMGALNHQTKEAEYLRRLVNNETIYQGFSEIFTFAQKKKLFCRVPSYSSLKPKKDPIDWMSYIDVNIWLGYGLLRKVDKVSMHHAIEVRTPFLDYRLVDYLFGVDSKLKVGDTNKHLLKKIATHYLPRTIIDRPKKGFNSPFNEWMFQSFGDTILEDILYVNEQTGLFHPSYVIHLYDQAKNRKFKQHLWTLYIFARWFKNVYL